MAGGNKNMSAWLTQPTLSI